MKRNRPDENSVSRVVLLHRAVQKGSAYMNRCEELGACQRALVAEGAS